MRAGRRLASAGTQWPDPATDALHNGPRSNPLAALALYTAGFDCWSPSYWASTAWFGSPAWIVAAAVAIAAAAHAAHRCATGGGPLAVGRRGGYTVAERLPPKAALLLAVFLLAAGAALIGSGRQGLVAAAANVFGHGVARTVALRDSIAGPGDIDADSYPGLTVPAQAAFAAGFAYMQSCTTPTCVAYRSSLLDLGGAPGIYDLAASAAATTIRVRDTHDALLALFGAADAAFFAAWLALLLWAACGVTVSASLLLLPRRVGLTRRFVAGAYATGVVLCVLCWALCGLGLFLDGFVWDACTGLQDYAHGSAATAYNTLSAWQLHTPLAPSAVGGAAGILPCVDAAAAGAALTQGSDLSKAMVAALNEALLLYPTLLTPVCDARGEGSQGFVPVAVVSTCGSAWNLDSSPASSGVIGSPTLAASGLHYYLNVAGLATAEAAGVVALYGLYPALRVTADAAGCTYQVAAMAAMVDDGDKCPRLGDATKLTWNGYLVSAVGLMVACLALMWDHYVSEGTEDPPAAIVTYALPPPVGAPTAGAGKKKKKMKKKKAPGGAKAGAAAAGGAGGGEAGAVEPVEPAREVPVASLRPALNLSTFH